MPGTQNARHLALGMASWYQNELEEAGQSLGERKTLALLLGKEGLSASFWRGTSSFLSARPLKYQLSILESVLGFIMPSAAIFLLLFPPSLSTPKAPWLLLNHLIHSTGSLSLVEGAGESKCFYISPRGLPQHPPSVLPWIPSPPV